jgi:uncharacterized small protein (DUF1192 family)
MRPFFSHRLGDLNARANNLHHEILSKEVALQQVNDHLNTMAFYQRAKQRLEAELKAKKSQMQETVRAIREERARGGYYR